MKSARVLKFPVQIALVALALCLLPGLGKAQSIYRGTFTLPFTAQWGSAVLPAGNYTIDMTSATAPYLLYVRGTDKTVIILAQGVDTKPVTNRSQLTVVNTARTHRIITLEAGQIGLMLAYSVPKSEIGPLASAKRATTAGSVSKLMVPVREASRTAAGL